ncbi:MAG: hypothetical protein C0439_04250 [Pseudomonas sp.]|nr:hypothetical protein [Pseudomonas sp.]
MTINKIQLRGGNPASQKSSLKYIRKHQGDPKNGGAYDSSIKKKTGTSEARYAEIFNRKMEGTRQKGQKNTYAFCSLSFSHADSKKLTDEQALEIAKDFYLNEAYPGNRHYHMTVENDKEHKHVHAIVGLTNLDTKKVNNKFVDFKPISEKIEAKYGLEKVARPKIEKPSPLATAPNTRKIEERTGKKTNKNDLKESVASAFLGSENFSQFIDNLQSHGVEFVPTTNSAGLSGASFEKDGEMFKGSQIGCSAAAIKEKFEKTKGFAQYIDFSKSVQSKINEERNLFNNAEGKKPKKFTHNKNFFQRGNEVLHKDTEKVAYEKVNENQFIIKDFNMKTILQAAKEMNSKFPDEEITTNAKNEKYRKNLWTICKQNGFACSDFYEPTKSDYEFAIKNCFDEKQKEKLQKELKDKIENNSFKSNNSSKAKFKM